MTKFQDPAEFQDRGVFVTGGNSGIGEATALAFGRAGARVAVVGRRQQANEQVAAQVRQVGGSAIAVQADVTDEQQVQSAVQATVQAFGSLDIAINNAGTWTPAPFTQITPQAWSHAARPDHAAPQKTHGPPLTGARRMRCELVLVGLTRRSARPPAVGGGANRPDQNSTRLLQVPSGSRLLDSTGRRNVRVYRRMHRLSLAN